MQISRTTEYFNSCFINSETKVCVCVCVSLRLYPTQAYGRRAERKCHSGMQSVDFTGRRRRRLTPENIFFPKLSVTDSG